MYGVSTQMSQNSSYEQANTSAGQNDKLSPELREVMHMLEAIEHKQPITGSKR